MCRRHPNTDLVLLSLPDTELIPAPRATHEPRVGQIVLAVGRPGKSGPMASLGVISLVGGTSGDARRQQLGRFLRTDAAMLPGFSGGPLVNAWGEVLGLNSSTLGRGSGFALPNEAIDRVVTALQTHGKVRRGFLGITAQPVTATASWPNRLVSNIRKRWSWSPGTGRTSRTAGLLNR